MLLSDMWMTFSSFLINLKFLNRYYQNIRRLNILSVGLYSRNDNLHMEKSNIYKSKVYITPISKHKTYADEGR